MKSINRRNSSFHFQTSISSLSDEFEAFYGILLILVSILSAYASHSSGFLFRTGSNCYV